MSQNHADPMCWAGSNIFGTRSSDQCLSGKKCSLSRDLAPPLWDQCNNQHEGVHILKCIQSSASASESSMTALLTTLGPLGLT